jgi:precorrin-2 dehydrogenase / sirohydrochlorin ferrochelatase
MRYYPVFLDLADKPVVVIGGGNIAHQKMENLLAAGAKVTVISPELNEEMTELKDADKFMYVKRAYEPGDIEGYELVFVATDDHDENRRVWQEGRERRIWVNAVDDIPNCDFIMPGIVKQGELIVAISTSGTSPAMARKAREDIQTFLTGDDAEMLSLAAEIRRELKEQKITVKGCDHCTRNNNDVWNAALDGEVKKLLHNGKRDKAKERVLNLLLSPSGQHEKVHS